ncbi:putative phosphatidylserine synthase 2-like [Capsicum annuum]|nr:putative phosphatidylserine synthase 2-like [Capsicum annuum]
MDKAKVVSTPLAMHFKLSMKQCPSNDDEKEDMKKVSYASVVGSLMYAMVCTRPDIAHAVGNPIFCGYTDSNMAGDIDTCKSTSGYLVTFAGGVVSCQSRLQKCVALSTKEAELIAAVEAYKEFLWMKRFLGELGCAQERYVLYCDSQSAIHPGKNSTFHGRSKHIDVRYHWIRDVLDSKLLELEKIHTDDNGSDTMTKALPRGKFEDCCMIAEMTVSSTSWEVENCWVISLNWKEKFRLGYSSTATLSGFFIVPLVFPNIAHLQRIGIGLFLSTAAMAFADLIKIKCKRVATDLGPLDSTMPLPIMFFWIVFQYLFLRSADLFTLAGLLEFYFSEAPLSMRSLATSLSWASLATGYYLSTMIVSIVNSVTGNSKYQPWLSGRNMNHFYLERFYWIICILSALNFIHYLYWDRTYKSLTSDSGSGLVFHDCPSKYVLSLHQKSVRSGTKKVTIHFSELKRRRYYHPLLDNEKAKICSICGTSRWKSVGDASTNASSKIPAKVLRYFPLKPRLYRIFMCPETAVVMKWHANE